MRGRIQYCIASIVEHKYEGASPFKKSNKSQERMNYAMEAMN